MDERAGRRSFPCRGVATLALLLLIAMPAGAVTPTERDALISLYNATRGQEWKTSTGWLGAPGSECRWSGVGCDANSSVIALFLGSNNLVGTIPATIADLPRLQKLYLNNNALSGPIPPQVGALASLSELLLQGNKLTGAIPPLGSLSNLKALVLHNNELSGSIPSLAGLRNLERLYLYQNQLSGPIPADIGSLTALQELGLFSNQLSGSIPQIGGLTNLRFIFLAGNKLTGPIPSLAGLRSLEKLYLSQNQLSGSIPADVGSLTALQELILNDNQLSGSIPQIGTLANLRLIFLYENKLTGPIPSLAGLRSLEKLFLSHNLLSGPIPADVGSLTALQELFLVDNQLSGSVPAQVGALANLRILSFSVNQLSGRIPDTVGDLSNLEQFDLSNNKFDGEIPATLGKLKKLQKLHLEVNALSGPIPNLGELSQLRELGAGSNQLTGEIPATLTNLTALEDLRFSNNQLSGPIPADIGRLGNLVVLDFSVNQLSGPVPPSILNLSKLRVLFLSKNALTGAFVSDIGKLSSLEKLYATENQLDGPIASDIGKLRSLTQLLLNGNKISGPLPETIGDLAELTDLYLASNQLSGPIPDSLGKLGKLQRLYISFNQLTGTLPLTLANLTNLLEFSVYSNQLSGTIPPGFERLTNLTRLDLGSNRFTGEIPAGLGKLTNLRFINFNSNQLSGTIPASIGDLAELTDLHLSSNQLSGPIPGSLGKLGKLQRLYIGVNQLTGTLPATLANLTNLLEFSAYSNQLSGTIPPGFERLTNLTRLNLGSNRFTGEVPAGLGKLTNLRFINFYSNQLSGTIPASMGDLAALEILGFATNSLEGRIPPQLGKLTKLRQLFLSSNRLEGAIPGEIANLTNLELLNVDANKLSGMIPPELATLQKLTTINLKFNGLSSSDAALNSFLAQRQPDWDQYQNVPPSDVRVSGVDTTTVALSWRTISPKLGGGYQIALANTPSGPFTVQQTTASKSISTAVVMGLSPATDYAFAVRSIAYPGGFGTNGERPYQQNQLISDYAPPVTARTNPEGSVVPNVIVFAFPSGPLIRGLGVDRDDRYVLTNIGQAPTTITLAQSAFFFTQSPTSFTLPPGRMQTVALNGTDQAPNVYEGTSIPLGDGVPAGLTIPVRLLVLSLGPANVVAIPSATRIDLSTDTNGSVDFTNEGTDTLIGVLVSDADWIEPQSRGLIEIPPRQRVTLRFSVNRAKRPLSDGSLTGGLYLVYPRTAAGLQALLANPLDAGNPGVSISTVSVVDTSRPPVSPGAAPPLVSGEVALFIPGIGTVKVPGAHYISDVNVVNAHGASAAEKVRIYYTPETSQVAPLRADLPKLSPNSLVSYGNIITSVFQSEGSGTLQIRAGGAIENITVSARIFNIQGRNGTYGTAVPVFRSDRAAAAGEEIVLTGVRKDANTRTNLFIQEMSGNPARFDIRFLDRDGAQISTYPGDVNPFSLTRVPDQVPPGAITAVITNARDSTGRIGAYATPVDSRSNDFWSVVDWSRHFGFERFEPMVIPVAGTKRGANNTFFRSDLVISNRSAFTQRGTLRFISGSSQVFETLIELAGGKSLGLDDLLGQQFSLTSDDAGYLVFAPLCESRDESLGPGGCNATFSLASRNFATVGDDPGTFGTAVPAVALSSALRLGQSRLIGGIEDVANTRGPGTYRTNVGLMETTGAAATVRVTVIKPETKGKVSTVTGASITVDLSPREYRQINGIAVKVLGSGSEIRNASLLFEVVGGDGAVMVFASSVDNGTGDAVLRVE